jgi:hypothetical protein
MIEIIFIFLVILNIISFKAKKNIALSNLDPIFLSWIKEVISIWTVYTFYRNAYLSYTFVNTYAVVYFFYTSTFLLFTTFFSSVYKQKLRFFMNIFLRKTTSLTILTWCIIFVYTIIFFATGLRGGDNRLDFYAAIRPIEPLLQVMPAWAFFFGLIIYRSHKARGAFFITILIFFSFYFGGKSAMLNFLLPLNLYIFYLKKSIKISQIILIFIIIFSGIFASIMLNYGIGSIGLAFNALIFRIQMDSDVLHLYFQQGYGEYTSVGSVFTYILSPFFKLLGLGSMTAENLGSQLASVHWQFYVPTGPNAHLPVVFYNASDYILHTIFASIIMFSIALILMLLHIEFTKKISLFGMMTLFFFVSTYSSLFFDPTTFVLYYIEHILFAVGFLFFRKILKNRI